MPSCYSPLSSPTSTIIMRMNRAFRALLLLVATGSHDALVSAQDIFYQLDLTNGVGAGVAEIGGELYVATNEDLPPGETSTQLNAFLHNVDYATGSVKQRVQIGTNKDKAGPIVAFGAGNLLVSPQPYDGASSTGLKAVRRADLSLLWTQPALTMRNSGCIPIVTSDLTILFDMRIRTFMVLADGSVKWNNSDYTSASCAILSPDESKVYLTIDTTPSPVGALSAVDGSLLTIAT